MALIRNRNAPPHGDRHVPLLGLFVPAGETAEVSDNDVELLLSGVDFELVEPDATPKPISEPIPAEPANPTEE